LPSQINNMIDYFNKIELPEARNIWIDSVEIGDDP
jgi:hypothetical protein